MVIGIPKETLGGENRVGVNPAAVKDLVKKGRFYVACETHEDLPYILNYTGAEHLIIGSDYSHADQSAELEALSILQARPDLDRSVTARIVDDNPSEFYGI